MEECEKIDDQMEEGLSSSVAMDKELKQEPSGKLKEQDSRGLRRR